MKKTRILPFGIHHFFTLQNKEREFFKRGSECLKTKLLTHSFYLLKMKPKTHISYSCNLEKVGERLTNSNAKKPRQVKRTT